MYLWLVSVDGGITARTGVIKILVLTDARGPSQICATAVGFLAKLT
jgi:hypothetical protein